MSYKCGVGEAPLFCVMGLAPLQGRFSALFHVRAMVRGVFTFSHCGLVCFRYFVSGLFRVACAVRVGHGVAAEVFEVEGTVFDGGSEGSRVALFFVFGKASVGFF